MQRHGDVDVWLNPPPIPLTTKEMDWVYDREYRRQPHPVYGDANIPAYKMIRFSIAIQRGCFGGCTFCSITEHEGRIIQSRSEDSVIREMEAVRDTVPGFTGVISDLGGPHREHVPSGVQDARDRKRLSATLVRVSWNLPEPEHRSFTPDQAVPARACAAWHQESTDRLGSALLTWPLNPPSM